MRIDYQGYRRREDGELMLNEHKVSVWGDGCSTVVRRINGTESSF